MLAWSVNVLSKTRVSLISVATEHMLIEFGVGGLQNLLDLLTG